MHCNISQDRLCLDDAAERVMLRAADRTGSQMAVDPALLQPEQMPLEIPGQQSSRVFTILVHVKSREVDPPIRCSHPSHPNLFCKEAFIPEKKLTDPFEPCG
jgi:hypothetical protein